MKKKVAILGASGYTGAELLRLLQGHSGCEVVALSAHSQAGTKVTELYPHLQSFQNATFQKQDDFLQASADADLVFSALPHGESMDILPSLKNRFIIDLGSDFRLQDASLYDCWYGRSHSCPKELPNWTYALPELFREEIAKSTRLANPGCFATAISLALAPLAKQGLLDHSVQVSAASGTSGAGRAPKSGMHFAHVFENFSAYKPGVHQHTPEIEHCLGRLCAREVKICFVPHLLPVSRGILATSFIELKDFSQERAISLFHDFYQGEKFVQVTEELIDTKQVRSSNRCVMCPRYDSRSGKLIILSAIDNLVKGASGQALQNANILLGFDEDCGLDAEALYP